MPIKRPENQIWCIYNHLPGGQLVAIHFEDIEKDRKEGETTKRVLITAKDQMIAFKKAPNVALYVIDPATGIGKLTKNELFMYDGPDAINLWQNRRAANVVIDYAKKKGIAPIPGKSDQKGDDPKTYEYDKRITALEQGQRSLDQKLDKVLEAVGAKK